ncbi:MAG TPA: hypothetical protein VLF71_02505 [Candidatus Saccharimonadales bacterium]|nr:hypothetical protein [Candidatus Saccharimonadales bacterium]
MPQFVGLSYADLTPVEAARLHPGNWAGHFPGSTSADGKPRTEFTPYRPGILGPQKIMRRALAAIAIVERAKKHPDQFTVTTLPPGMRLLPGEYPENSAIMLDHERVLTRGKNPYRLDTSSFPAHPGEQAAFNGQPVHEQGPHMHYRRGLVPVVPMGEGDSRHFVAPTNMEARAGLNEYPWQVGTVLLPSVVEIGAVYHELMMTGGHESMSRVNAAQIVIPR